MRTGILAEELVRRGHEVVWWTSAFNHNAKTWLKEAESGDFVTQSGITLKFLRGTGYKKNVSIQRYLDHSKIAQDFKKRAQAETPPDCIVMSIPTYDLAYQALLYSRAHKVVNIVDVRDPWPDYFIEHCPALLKPLLKLVLKRDYFMLREVMKHADGVVSMMENMLEWGLSYSGRKRNNETDDVFFLGADDAAGNSSSLSADCLPAQLEKIKQLAKDRLVVGYLGTFGQYSAPYEIEELAEYYRRNEDICFVLAGEGGIAERVRERVEGIDNVIMPGWLDQQEITAVLELCDVAVVPTGREMFQFPNKAFVYLSNSLPIISSGKGELQGLLDEYNAGLYYQSRDSESFKAAIEQILKKHANGELAEMQSNARRLFEEKLKADIIYGNYADYLERLVRDKSDQG